MHIPDKVTLKTPHGNLEVNIWKPGMPIDYHVALKRRTKPTDFVSKCCKCQETVYHNDLSCANKGLICMDCLMQIPIEEIEDMK